MKMEKIDTNPRKSSLESADKLIDAAIESAAALQSELSKFNDTDVIGAGARAEVDELAAELTEALKNIPAADCLTNGLPYHPTDEKYEWPSTEFPSSPDYPVDYKHQPKGPAYPDRYPRADELASAS